MSSMSTPGVPMTPVAAVEGESKGLKLEEGSTPSDYVLEVGNDPVATPEAGGLARLGYKQELVRRMSFRHMLGMLISRKSGPKDAFDRTELPAHVDHSARHALCARLNHVQRNHRRWSRGDGLGMRDCVCHLFDGGHCVERVGVCIPDIFRTLVSLHINFWPRSQLSDQLLDFQTMFSPLSHPRIVRCRLVGESY